MGTKIIILALLCFGSFTSIAQGTEEQRKYILPETITPTQFVDKSKLLNGLSTHFHSEYIVYDIYIDNSDYVLFENRYSLRFRKKIIADTIITYTFQLKSEMIVPSDVRMEIEETELDFYRVIDGDKWVSISSVLDKIFSMEESTIEVPVELFNHEIDLLKKWIRQKADAPIAPFQKLKHIDSVLFSSTVLKTLEPTLIGVSQRNRAHVYIDNSITTEALKSLPMNRQSLNDRPTFFVEHPEFNWILETSMDHSIFRSIVDPNFISQINEYEVEDKYFNASKGTELLKRYEKELVETLGCRAEMASKYRQSIVQMIYEKEK